MNNSITRQYLNKWLIKWFIRNAKLIETNWTSILHVNVFVIFLIIYKSSRRWDFPALCVQSSKNRTNATISSHSHGLLHQHLICSFFCLLLFLWKKTKKTKQKVNSTNYQTRLFFHLMILAKSNQMNPKTKPKKLSGSGAYDFRVLDGVMVKSPVKEWKEESWSCSGVTSSPPFLNESHNTQKFR